MSSPAQLTRLMSNRLLAHIGRLRIGPSQFSSHRRGERLSKGRGRSTEFSDYRDYVAGDDLRFLDWNIMARLQRPYVKLFHTEQEQHLVLLIDASASMGFEDKLARAQQLAAAFGLIGLHGPERVSVWAFGGEEAPVACLPPAGGRRHLQKLFGFIEGLKAGGRAPLDAQLAELGSRHRGRGVLLVLSDFLTPGDLKPAFNRLNGQGLEVWGLQLLGPGELSPEVSGDLRLVDSEEPFTLDVSSAGDLLSLYHEYRLAHEREMGQLCSGRGGRFLSVCSDESLESLVLDRLRRAGWVRNT